MALTPWQRYITDAGVLVSGAQIDVFLETDGTRAVLKADAAGTALGNPFTTGISGLAKFYTEPSPDGFRILVTYNGNTAEFRNMPLGDAQFYGVGDDADGKLMTRAQLDVRFAKAVATVETVSDATHTMSASDSDLVQFTNGSAVTVTLPPTATEDIPVGTIRFYEKAGAGDITFVAGSGATMNAADSYTDLTTQYKTVCVIVTAAQTFLVIGLES